jgi:hypothetical protein
VGLLTEAQLKATMGDPMLPVTESTPLPEGFWSYFETIPAADMQGYEFGDGRIERAYRGPDGFDHVLLASNDPDVFLVIVLATREALIYGHHLLDLPRVYGLG